MEPGTARAATQTSGRRPTRRRRGGRVRALLALAVATLPVACAILQGAQEKVPPQGWRKSRGPVVPHDSFPEDCSLCHLEGGWQRIRADFRFDHLQETGVELRGAHASAECLRCHNDRGSVERFAQRGCAGCHEDVHQGRLGQGCKDCHGESGWQPEGMIALHYRTRFPLLGAHAAVACFRCHPGAEVGNFQRADTRCESCHLPDAQRARSFDHVGQGLLADCQRCHTPTGWGGAHFTHPWPLNGGHAGVACVQCHAGAGSGNYLGASRLCETCHLDDAQRATTFDHVGTGLTNGCDRCHTVQAWRPANFTHRFPLRGPHDVACTVCHAGGTTAYTCLVCHEHRQSETDNEHRDVRGYSYTSTACVSCHPNGRH